MNERKKYDNLDMLRTLAAIGVLCMHVLANSEEIPLGFFGNYILYSVVGSFGSFVQLFFLISGFAMCCGYYDRIKENKISLNTFYNKRYIRILPFFLLLTVLDLLACVIFGGGITWGTLCEAFANTTLMYGFFTTSGMSVIGVGWTLGVIFGFYILFPFFVYLIWTKGRAWISLAVTVGIYLANALYFNAGNSLVFVWICYFVAGGLLYLYRDKIESWMRHPLVGILVAIAGFALAFFVPNPLSGAFASVFAVLKRLLAFSMMVAGAMCPTSIVWSNPVTRFISRYSLEIYLSHMLIFRILEKLHMTTLFGATLWSYFLSCTLVTLGTFAFSLAYRFVESKIKIFIETKKRNRVSH